MHPLFAKADAQSGLAIGAAIEVHRNLGPGLLESIYEKCMIHEFGLRGSRVENQRDVSVTYKGLTFLETLRFDVLVDKCLLLEIKAVERLLPVHKAQLMSYMKLMDIPIGLLVNFHEPILKNGLVRLVLPGANKSNSKPDNEISVSADQSVLR
ncbi:MAG: GxxExxY protein [Opitutaceae bacterium]|jgi:GxxExxY protein